MRITSKGQVQRSLRRIREQAGLHPAVGCVSVVGDFGWCFEKKKKKKKKKGFFGDEGPQRAQEGEWCDSYVLAG